MTATTDPLQPVGARRLLGLDGLRAISIALVLLAHGWETIPLPRSIKSLSSTFLANASLGVTVFFVLSGFLITHLLKREFNETLRISLKGFYLRRILRIFPALYTYLITISLLAYFGIIHTSRGDLLRAGSFTTNYGFLFNSTSSSDYWFVGHFWTLSLEEQFYLFWPILLIAIGLRSAWIAAIVIVGASPLIRTASYFIWPASREHLGMMLHCASDSIMMGSFAALVSDRKAVRRIVESNRSSVAAFVAVLFLAVPSALLVATYHGAYSVTVGTTLNAAMIAYCVLVIVDRSTSSVVRFLERESIRRLGVLSYSLYLWQQLFLGGAHWEWAVFPINFLACFSAALISHFIIERPFLRLRQRWTARPDSPVRRT